jgi:acetyl esterase/lipase
MSDEHRPPPLDPECEPAWRAYAEQAFGGSGLRLDPDTLKVLRATEWPTRESLLADRPFTHEDLTVPGPGGDLTLAVFRPHHHRRPAPAVYWIHGGGMVSGTRFEDPEALDATTGLGAVVVSVEYRLAPEHPSPAPFDDCLAGLMWLADHAIELGVDPTRIVLGGISAGGGLAAATALRIRDLGGPRLVGLLLCCPMLDDRMTSVSSSQFGDDLLWTRASNAFAWACLLGERAGTDAVSPHEAPGRATDLGGLPPTLIDVGSADLFRDENVAFATGIWASGGEAELHVWAGGFHGSEQLAPDATVSVAARAARADWIRRILSRA